MGIRDGLEVSCFGYLERENGRRVQVGEMLVSNTGEFGLTEGREYEALSTTFELVTVLNDLGVEEDYTLEYFHFKW